MNAQLFSVVQAASALSVHPSYVRRLCAMHKIGEPLSPRIRILTEADLDRLRPLIRPRGNPDFGPGYKPEKASKKPLKKSRKKSPQEACSKKR